MGNEFLKKIARKEPFYKRNQARVCTFYAKGLCNRGIECPYRHEIANKSDLSNQNYHDRYFGINDSVAVKMLAHQFHTSSPKLIVNSNTKTIFIRHVKADIIEKDIREVFYSYGEIDKIKVLPSNNCAFVTYYSRQAVETAILNFSTSFSIKGITLTLSLEIPKKQISSYDKLTPESIPTHLLKSIWGTSLPNFSNFETRRTPYDAMDP